MSSVTYYGVVQIANLGTEPTENKPVFAYDDKSQALLYPSESQAQDALSWLSETIGEEAHPKFEVRKITIHEKGENDGA